MQTKITANATAMKRWLSKAEESLGNHSDRLNAINIFPVADGDTGTNLYLTVRAASQAANAAETTDLGELLRIAGQAAMEDARGNSGTLFAVFLATVTKLNSGQSHVDDISDEDVVGMIAGGYRASSDVSIIGDASCIVICVPTPLASGGAPDLGAVIAATQAIAENMKTGALVILESTTYPGTTEDVVRPILESGGQKLDKDFFLAFSPERIDPGNKLFGLRNTPKVIGGISSESTRLACQFYLRFVDEVVPVKGAREAETAKLLENTYRHINIALVNEMSKFCHELKIDLWDVIGAAKTKPYGFQAFYPGPGVGGHCIPIDPNYLSYEVRKTLNYPFRFVELAEEINNSMPRYVVQRVQELLNREKKSVNGSKVLLFGVTYKPNIADQRESPASEIADLFDGMGAEVSYHDPYVAAWRSPKVARDRVTDLDTAVSTADIVVLLQDHEEYDLKQLPGRCRLMFDTRGKVPVGTAHRF
ncbi:nucleotide sugar dehydrogenase [Arthrobacter sp. AET 35A]|uniref:nucleotide sugar dehydrogenase n=1 Tax=Arthrobacter sp. AET 35A TaxID=2292643 RepID=UPI001CE2607B|nr:nucleotide sugar dehydrogenase [Arthrobacter sp. AET 35A]